MKPILLSLTFVFVVLLTPVYAESPPNIVLLMGDDHGWDEVGYNGHPYVKTPVLDEMATQGLRFDRFYAAHPSCSPTRGSIITGRHPNRYGTFSPNWSLRPEEIGLATLLRQAGYTSGHFGKWHLGPVKQDSPTSPGAMGFDEWLAHDNFFELNPVLSHNGATPKVYPGESSEVVVAEAMRFIEQSQKQKKPFFVNIWFGSPHEPYSGLPKDLALYDDLPASLAEKTVRLTSNETGQAVKRPLRDVLRERYAEITAMDRAIGQLRSFLKQKNLRDNTIVWYYGDNGTPSSAARTGMTLRNQKGTMYEGGVRVPGVLEWPAGIPHPLTSRINAVTTDMLPTLCELADVTLPQRPLDGISLVPVFTNTLKTRPLPIFFWAFKTGQVFDKTAKPYISPALQEGTTPLVKMMAGKYTRTFRNYHYPKVSPNHFGGPRVVLDNQYKLVLDGEKNQESVELFDLEKDPAESQNLAQSHPRIVKSMQEQMRTWQSSVLNSLTGADY